MPTKPNNRQTYYNIVSGLTIAVLAAAILGAWGWVGKMSITVNKAELARMETERNNALIKEKNKILHGRITALQKQLWAEHEKLDRANEIIYRSDERSLMMWQLYLRTIR